MMPKIEASKNESKPAKIGLPVTFEPLIYPHDFLKSHFNEVDKGGHFAAWEQPELFASEVRAAFKSLR
jgi:pimeloyl-ACP methyl ester carboxylesterase